MSLIGVLEPCGTIKPTLKKTIPNLLQCECGLYFQMCIYRYWKYLQDGSPDACDKVTLVGTMKQDVQELSCQVNIAQ